jgi:biotin transport system substrate-specific component
MTLAKSEAAALDSRTLYEFLTASRPTELLHAFLIVLGGTALLALSAKISVPFYPVPMTFQPLAVVLIGATFGPRLGGATVLAYLIEGAAGLPVFATGAGLGYLVGPTGGYLVGFLLAAIVVGALARRGWDRNPLTMAAAMIVGMALIYIPGVLWLGTVIGWNKPLLSLGVTPFLLGDVLKVALGALLMPAAWHLARKRQ